MIFFKIYAQRFNVSMKRISAPVLLVILKQSAFLIFVFHLVLTEWSAAMQSFDLQGKKNERHEKKSTCNVGQRI